MIEKELEKIGLTQSEVKIYLTLLKFGVSTTSDLSKKAKIHRTYIYDILEKLIIKGLVSTFKEKSKKYFIASSPSKIKNYIEEKLDIIENILPQLEKLKIKNSNEVSVEIYKGIEGLKTILSDLVQEGTDYYGIGSWNPIEDALPIYMKKIIREINEKKLKERAILPEGEIVIEANDHKHRYLKKELINMYSMLIYSDRVCFTLWNPEPIQILIKSEDLANAKREEFKILWEIATE